MKKLFVLLLLFLVSCSTSNKIQKNRHYNYYNFNEYEYYWDPFPYGKSYGFGIGYDYYPTYHRRQSYKVVIVPKENYVKPKTNTLPEKRQDKGIYNPTYKRPVNNTTPRFNGTPTNGTRQQPSEGSKPINRRIIR